MKHRTRERSSKKKVADVLKSAGTVSGTELAVPSIKEQQVIVDDIYIKERSLHNH